MISEIILIVDLLLPMKKNILFWNLCGNLNPRISFPALMVGSLYTNILINIDGSVIVK